jgi:hypothetical protein
MLQVPHARVCDNQSLEFIAMKLTPPQLDLAPYDQRLKSRPSHQPGAALPTERVIRRGSGRHHAAQHPQAKP